MSKRRPNTTDAAEFLAIQALGFLAEDPERLGRFIALTGIGPDQLRAAAHEPRFLAGVLDYVVGDEALLKDFAASVGQKPAIVEKARAALGGGDWERDVP